MTTIKLIESTGFDKPEQKIKRDKAILVLGKVINSKEFETEVLNFSSSMGKCFIENEGMSNEQILQTILDSKTFFAPEVKNCIQLYLELDYGPNKKGVGYRFINGKTIYTYANWYKRAKVEEYAKHLMHEWLHILDFDHTSDEWRYSVPYGIGKIVERIAKQYV